MARPRWQTWGKPAIKLALGALVLWAVGRHASKTWHDLHAKGGALRIDPGWVAASVGLYLAGLCAFGAYYGAVMRAGATPIGTAAAVRAYLISHLGKYVPGKAMVVVMRVGLSTPYGARPAAAAFATLYETLAMMAAGGLLAAAGFATHGGAPLEIPTGVGGVLPVPLSLLSLGLGLAFLVVVSPPVFPRLSGLARVPFPGVGPDALPRLTWGLLAEGMLWSLAGWTLLGLSQVAVVRAIAVPGAPISTWPAVIASVALATVAGFVVAVLPGGLGVREGVLMATLAPSVGADVAVVSALALRLAWVLGELLVALALTFVRPPLPAASSSPSPMPSPSPSQRPAAS